MRYLNYLLALVMACVLAACGGGGGSAGSTPGGGGGGGGTGGGGGGGASLELSLVDDSDVALSTHSINKSGVFYAKAIVKSADGSPVSNQLVTFTTDYAIATLAGGISDVTSMTDSAGTAKVLISPLSLSTVGASSLGASATVNGSPVVSSLNFSTTASNVALANMTLTPTTIGALETSAVTVQGLVDGSPATGTSVAVTFSASCGSFSPESSNTNNLGYASSTYQSAATCSGPVTLTSSTAGAASLSQVISVVPASPASIVFDSATPTLIYVSSAASGSKTSVVRFRVLDSNAAGMSSQSVRLLLSGAARTAGVTLSGSTDPYEQVVTTDADGFASIAVSSGSFPTPISVSARLDATPSIQAASIGLAVTTGAPTQNSVSFNAAKHSLEAQTIAGLTTDLVFRVADRLGNAVPDGTVVNFIASHGLITSTCVLSASTCTVSYRAIGVQPPSGRAGLLAYLDGEESFTDLNGNNLWDSTEPYWNVGEAYLDVNGDLAYDAGDQIVPSSGGAGPESCSPPADSNYSMRPNTCDAQWSSAIRVRAREVITWASSTAQVELLTSPVPDATGFNVLVASSTDIANAMPAGSTVGVAVDGTSACAVTSVNPPAVSDGHFGASVHKVSLNGDSACMTADFVVTVTTPSNRVSTDTVSFPP